jgi:hypothetical protein
MMIYALWQITYCIFIYVLQAEKVFNGKRTTSFSWLLADYLKNHSNSPLTRLMIFVGPKFQVWVFMLINFIYAVMTLIPTYFLYNNYNLHMIFICFVVMISIFNGADYYIEVFSARYRSELARVDGIVDADEETLLEATFNDASDRGKKRMDIHLEKKPRRISVKDLFEEKSSTAQHSGE